MGKKKRLSILQRTYLKLVAEEASIKLKKILLGVEMELLKIKRRDVQAAAWVKESRMSK